MLYGGGGGSGSGGSGGGGMSGYGDKASWERKQAAVDAGALELLHASVMAMVGRDKHVHDTGMQAIGCLCNGRDKNATKRRARAHALFRRTR